MQGVNSTQGASHIVTSKQTGRAQGSQNCIDHLKVMGHSVTCTIHIKGEKEQSGAVSEQGQAPSSHTVALCSCMPFPLFPAAPVSGNCQQIQQHSLGNSTRALCPEREKQGTGTSPPRSTLPRRGEATIKASLLPHFTHRDMPGSEEGPGEGQSSTLFLMPTELTVTTRTNLRPGSLTEVG